MTDKLHGTSDTARLRYMMGTCDGFSHLSKDRYEYASEVADENGRDEPNADDELEGFRRLIDCAMAGGDMKTTVEGGYT